MEVYSITRSGRKLEVVEIGEVKSRILSCAAMWKTAGEWEMANRDSYPIASASYNMYHDLAGQYDSMAQALFLSLKDMELITEEEYNNYRTKKGDKEHD